jgi:hypothetical protein
MSNNDDNSSKIDYLTEDTLIPNDQKFICLSFLNDKDNKTSLCGIKFRGAFETYEKACEHAKKLQSVDSYFNVFVGDAGKWLPYDPNPDSKFVKDSEYANDELNKMMKSYLENQEKAKIYHEQRKTEMIRQNVLDNLSTTQNNLSDIKKKYKKSNDDDEKNKMDTEMKNIEEQIKNMEEKKKELDKEIEKHTEQIQSFSSKNLEITKIEMDEKIEKFSEKMNI